MRTLLIGLIVAAAALTACDKARVDKLEEGVATEADVRSQFGEPAAVYHAEDGSKTLEYPRQPEGQRNYMITIGADGRMSALRQVLQPAVFAQVTPGLDKAQVRRLLGKPARAQAFPLKNEEVWDWRYLDGNENRVFSVTFDPDGRVLDTASAIDPRELQQGG
ncbi:outer membrane protein assembly factor BamE domain-containing protein [Caldimonas brevitalea]|uniref:Lipoprotein n=1 Tax=Caldimonas brevitalea TaxID=413882 RepID=A0A0G3BKY0_9BURK|nr:outer membrane protein assembly factor BamE [Caldimonas brevitalea]AKJ28016.1 lipoprotein [Caldimonas brevitalea]